MASSVLTAGSLFLLSVPYKAKCGRVTVPPKTVTVTVPQWGSQTELKYIQALHRRNYTTAT